MSLFARELFECRGPELPFRVYLADAIDAELAEKEDEIERLEGIIANYFSSGDAAELHDEFIRICVKGEGR